jgi:hypothetical protein
VQRQNARIYLDQQIRRRASFISREFLTFARVRARAGNWRKSSVFRDSELAARALLAPENAIFDAI